MTLHGGVPWQRTGTSTSNIAGVGTGLGPLAVADRVGICMCTPELGTRDKYEYMIGLSAVACPQKRSNCCAPKRQQAPYLQVHTQIARTAVA
jgi:hypothetical protein